jgi:predicted  nucleic acid-binding Zn-ribbon protein
VKHLPAVILGLLCLGLAIALFLSKRDNDAQQERYTETITTASNLLVSAEKEVAAFKGKVASLSNQFETCQSTSLTFSNELIDVKSALATTKESLERQITDLKAQSTQQLETEKQASSQRIAELTNHISDLTNQIASAQTNLLQANKDYALLDNRFRRDVAERVIVERRFYNRQELKAQLEMLQWNPAKEISEDRIREGLNVVVGKSNLCYVIAPEEIQTSAANHADR